MSKFGKRLIAAAERALAHSKGEDVGYTEETFVIPDKIDVKAIRMSIDMTQSEFASFYGFGVASVRSWEQGVRKPNQSTRLFLTVIERRPNIIQEVFSGDMKISSKKMKASAGSALTVKRKDSKTRQVRAGRAGAARQISQST